MQPQKERPGCRRVLEKIMDREGLTLVDILTYKDVSHGLYSQAQKMLDESGDSNPYHGETYSQYRQRMNNRSAF